MDINTINSEIVNQTAVFLNFALSSAAFLALLYPIVIRIIAITIPNVCWVKVKSNLIIFHKPFSKLNFRPNKEQNDSNNSSSVCQSNSDNIESAYLLLQIYAPDFHFLIALIIAKIIIKIKSHLRPECVCFNISILTVYKKVSLQS